MTRRWTRIGSTATSPGTAFLHVLFSPAPAHHNCAKVQLPHFKPWRPFSSHLKKFPTPVEKSYCQQDFVICTIETSCGAQKNFSATNGSGELSHCLRRETEPHPHLLAASRFTLARNTVPLLPKWISHISKRHQQPGAGNLGAETLSLPSCFRREQKRSALQFTRTTPQSRAPSEEDCREGNGRHKSHQFKGVASYLTLEAAITKLPSEAPRALVH